MIQAASDAGNAAGLVFFLFDLLHLDGDDVGARPLIERKARLFALLANAAPPLHYSDYHRGQGPAFHEQACKPQLEGIVSKRADAAYAPGNRGLWLKVKCLHREEIVVVGWTPIAAASSRSESQWTASIKEVRFARDSPLEGAGFELSVPRQNQCKGRSPAGGEPGIPARGRQQNVLAKKKVRTLVPRWSRHLR
jgi:hypothetical protein